MMKASILFLHFSILILIQWISSSKGEVVEKWIEQFQDHFDPYNRRTWWMRYYENDEFFKGTGPMFIMIGGERFITSVDVETGFMFEMAEIHGAILYHIEHRYYGSSRPVPNTNFENLKYLNIKQALSDIAFFIIEKKEELRIPDVPVIVFGCSYAGNLAAWMRVKYPKLVHGAVAISAPIYIKTEFPEYFEAVADSLRKYDENCATAIKEAFFELEELLRDPVLNSATLKYDFNLDIEIDLSQSREVMILISSLAHFIGSTVLYNSIESNGETSIANLCVSMTEDEDTTSAYNRLAEIIRRNHVDHSPLLELNYDEIIDNYARTSWASPFTESIKVLIFITVFHEIFDDPVVKRLWYYQTCTELGCKRTFSSPNSIFGSRISLENIMKVCGDIFGEDFNPNTLNNNVKWTNSVNNARLSNTTNIIFINGDVDPWHVLSVLHDLNDDSPAILISGTSHCEFLNPSRLNSLIEASCRVAGILFDWIQE